MPDLLPFRGLRYKASDELSALTAPPYDVIDEGERAALEATHPLNSVRLILPRAEGGHDAYDTAAERLTRWQDDGILVRESEAAYYGYRMRYTDPAGIHRSTVGVIGALGLDAEGAPLLPHERTLPKAASDRLALLRATHANLDPIWALSLTDGFAARVGTPNGHRVLAHDLAGVEHAVWPIVDAVHVAAIRDAAATTPMVLADGHHRYETASRYAADGAAEPGAGAVMALVVELASDALWVQAIHRLVHGFGPDAAAALRDRLTVGFELIDLGPNTPDGVGRLVATMSAGSGLGFVEADRLTALVPHPGVLAPLLAGEPEVLADVDTVRFDVAIRPHLGTAALSYRNDAAVVAATVARRDADVAFLERPVTVAQIRAAAFAGVRMPEKTTFFAPKPLTGMVFRSLAWS